MFEDRADAGRRLAGRLSGYRNSDAIVLAIPNGGVEVGYEVAHKLDIDLEVIVARKLPFEDNPEAGFGAVCEDGSIYLHPAASKAIDEKTIDSTVGRQDEEVRKRVKLFRKGRELADISGRTAIIVDDGIAMGSTIRAAIMCCRNKGAGKVVAAVPVAGIDVAKDVERVVDEMVVVEMPAYFHAVAHLYHEWHDVSYQRVVDVLEMFAAQRKARMHF